MSCGRSTAGNVDKRILFFFALGAQSNHLQKLELHRMNVKGT